VPQHPIPRLIGCVTSGHDIYDKLDEYVVDVARKLLLGAPLHDSALAHDLVPCFIRYYTGAQFISRLLN
jgi:hypothetical protein